MLTVRVPASASNLGAGFDCVGLALDLWLEARLIPGVGPPIYGGTLAALSANDDMVLRALGGATPDGHRLELHSEIPIARGLGSSGAAAVAGITLAQLVRREPIDPLRVYLAARRVEGHPDNVAPAVFGGLVLAVERPAPLTLDPMFGIACAVPDTGIDTQQARRLLPARINRDTAVAQAANASALLLGLTRGDPDLVRQGMVDLIAVPTRAALIGGFEQAVEAGLDAGALGVTISGSGSTVLAVCPQPSATEVAASMAAALTRKGNPARPLVPNVSLRGFEVAKATTAAPPGA